MPEDSLDDAPQERARKAFIDLVAGEDASINLARAALLIALEEYPQLDIECYMKQLDRLAARVRKVLDLDELASESGTLTQLPNDIDILKVIDAMNLVLFEQEHFQGNQENYYNPSNSFLNDVLENHRGIPITLSLLYMEVGRRIGLQIEGIGLPFHFVVRCRLPNVYIYIDPFDKGRLLSEEDCRERIYRLFRHKAHFDPHWLEPVSQRQILIRMLANLKNIYINQEDYVRALSICDRILLLVPNAPLERRDRGIVHFHLKNYARALRDLTAYVEHAPKDEDTSDVRQQIKAIRQMIAMMN
jgi:regulator of sirC expression with transglutaminase-like and TPR domain